MYDHSFSHSACLSFMKHSERMYSDCESQHDMSFSEKATVDTPFEIQIRGKLNQTENNVFTTTPEF